MSPFPAIGYSSCPERGQINAISESALRRCSQQGCEVFHKANRKCRKALATNRDSWREIPFYLLPYLCPHLRKSICGS